MTEGLTPGQMVREARDCFDRQHVVDGVAYEVVQYGWGLRDTLEKGFKQPEAAKWIDVYGSMGAIVRMVDKYHRYALGREPGLGWEPRMPNPLYKVAVMGEVVSMVETMEVLFDSRIWPDQTPVPNSLGSITVNRQVSGSPRSLAIITYRALEAASMCRGCEQTEGWTGLMVHAGAMILARKLRFEGGFYRNKAFRLWGDTYPDAYSELSSPVLVGMVDLMIEMSRHDTGIPRFWPRLRRFFNSPVKYEGFEGTYFDMTGDLY